YASSTMTCAIVTRSGPSLRTESPIPSASSTARSIVRRSTGGTSVPRRCPAGSVVRMAMTRSASSASGTKAATQKRKREPDSSGAVSGLTAAPHGFEHSHPSEFGKLALVRVKHESTGIAETGLENRAFSLAQHDGIGRLGRRTPGARTIHVEEHTVK